MAQRTPQDQDKFVLRLPDGMRDRIRAAAEANNRSMNSEIVAALEDKFPRPTIDVEASSMTEWLDFIDSARDEAEQTRRLELVNQKLLESSSSKALEVRRWLDGSGLYIARRGAPSKGDPVLPRKFEDLPPHIQEYLNNHPPPEKPWVASSIAQVLRDPNFDLGKTSEADLNRMIEAIIQAWASSGMEKLFDEEPEPYQSPEPPS